MEWYIKDRSAQMEPRTAVVMGGTGVVGKAIVRRLLEVQYMVVAVSRHQAGLEGLKDELLRYRETLSVCSADARNEEQVANLFENQQRIDAMVYAVGIEPDPEVPLVEYTLPAWHATFDSYVTGFFLCFRESMKHLRPRGHVMAISSAVTRLVGHSIPAGIYVGHYAAAKAALDELCKWGRRETHQRGVLLSRIAPGAIDCPYHRNAPPHRHPVAMVSARTVADRVASALVNNEEIDEVLVAAGG